MRPERGITTRQYRAASDFDSVGEVYLMSSCYDAAIPQQKPWIDWVNNIGVRNGVNLVQAHYFRIPSQRDFASPTNNVQMPNPNVLPDAQLFHAQHQIQMTYLNVIVDRTLARIYDAETDFYPAANLITKEEAIEASFEKRREKRD